MAVGQGSTVIGNTVTDTFGAPGFGLVVGCPSNGTDQVLGQILRYMGWVIEDKGTDVRGIIIVQNKDRRLSIAINAATNVQIKEFRMVFDSPA
jgi:hypothetical protein